MGKIKMYNVQTTEKIRGENKDTTGHILTQSQFL